MGLCLLLMIERGLRFSESIKMAVGNGNFRSAEKFPPNPERRGEEGKKVHLELGPGLASSLCIAWASRKPMYKTRV